MKTFVTVFFLSLLGSLASAQALFPKTMKNVPNTGFCIDCGDIKAGKDSVQFSNLLKFITSHNYINRTKGIVRFQVLIDSAGSGTVLSHTDTTNSVLVQNIVHALNSFKGWKPAVTNALAEPLVSIVIAMEISNDRLSAEIQRNADEQYLAENSGSFDNTPFVASAKTKSFFVRKVFGFRNNYNYGSRSFLNSFMAGLGFSIGKSINEQNYPRNSFNPTPGQIYDPFYFNRPLPQSIIQQNNTFSPIRSNPIRLQVKSQE